MQNRYGIASTQALVGSVFSVVGAAAVAIAPAVDKSAFVMSPGLEGCLTAGVVGFALAILGGVGYLTTAAIALPIFLAQYLGCRGAGEPVLATLGLEALMLGLVGLGMTSRKAVAREAPASAPEPVLEAGRPARRRRAADMAVVSATLRG
jgi:hypothetical protein